ncbi:ABC transporter permease subunit, partial [Ilumatobacter nonamiensis]|uniref:ABC transporter permease subunit n=1 Tax=Ilumatobacter nonamiensis TaxID=467093 RepID=UPI00058D4743
RRTGIGRRFLAVRDNERAAAAAGINVARTKLLAFMLSSGIAGIGGVMLGFKQVEVSSANFLYGFSLSVLAFAYLAGITSINGAMVAGMLLSAGALVPTTSNYFFAGTNIDNYLAPLGGIGIIVTAIIHPEGVAPFFGEGMRHAGDWIVHSVPGLETIRRNYRGARGVLVKVVLASAVVGFAFLVYNIRFTDIIEFQILIWVAIVYLALLAFARFLGPLSPTFPEAGSQWVSWAKRFGPTAVVGAILGYLVWPLRVDTYDQFWMPLYGAALALFARSIYRIIRYGRPSGDDDSGPPHHDLDDMDHLDTLPAHEGEHAPEMI